MSRIFEILPADVAMPPYEDVVDNALDGDIGAIVILLIALLLVAAIVTIIVVAVRRSKKKKTKNEKKIDQITNTFPWDK